MFQLSYDQPADFFSQLVGLLISWLVGQLSACTPCQLAQKRRREKERTTNGKQYMK